MRLRRYLAMIPFAVLAAATMACTPEEDNATTTDPATSAVVEGDADEADDVELASCAGGVSGMTAAFNIVNNSSKPSNYMIEVAFESADGLTQHGTGMAFANGVMPGQTAHAQAHSFTDEVPGFVCRISSVERLAG